MSQDKQKTRIEKVIEFLGLATLTGVLVITALQVALRYIFRSPLPWAEEICRLLEAWVIFLGSYVALRRGVHVSVDFFVKMMPKGAQRVVTICSNILILIFLGVVFKASFTLIQGVWGTTSSAAGYPAPLFPAALSFGMLIMFVEVLRQTILLIRGRDAGILVSTSAKEEGM